jgi:hypothetical protein
MTVAFEAKFVSCVDAIGGEILQVTFDTLGPGKNEDERRSPYVLISRNFEFPGAPTIEWFSGNDYDGGAEITSLALTRDRVLIKLDRDLDFDVSFRLPDRQFKRLGSFLRRMMDAHVLDAVSFSNHPLQRARR